jgi:alpha-tubulin suppressor-like RCC1 family protein
VDADCPGNCQSCNTSHACVAAVSQDDPNGRCAGTCDATGACKSKKGQTCQTVATGCASGTTCAPDGYCCDTACAGSCQACDIPGYLGTCTPVASGSPHGNRASCGTDASCGGTCAGKADGTCSYPTKNCGTGPTCSGTDKIIAQSTCASGICQDPAATTCSSGFACSANACKTICQTSADCQADYFCYNQTCHSDVVSVGVGGNVTCVSLKDGRAMCWGYNALGDGASHTSEVGTPLQVTGLANAKIVKASGNSVCALTASGTVACWGFGQYGQLGNGTNTPAAGQGFYFSNSPVSVVTAGGTDLTGIVSLYSGADAFCAISSTAVYCWGQNAGGMLGFSVPSNPENILSAVQVQGAPALSPFGMGFSFQFGVENSTTLQAWGMDSYGTVDPAASDAIFPNWNSKTVTTTTGISQVVGGARTGCVLYVDGQVQCWGSNLFGALGNGTSVGDDDPIPGHKITGLTATHIASGEEFMCAQTSDTTSVYCWGLNDHGVIGPDTSTNYSIPTRVSLSLPVGLSVTEVASSATSGTVCTIISDGSLMCWGSNGYLETGTGSTSSAVTVPTIVQANW